MKQKIVIRVQMTCQKCRSKAMTIAASTSGVISVAIGGKDKDEVVVIGDGVDAACLTVTLCKKLKYAKLITVEEVKEEKKKPEPPKPEEKKKPEPPKPEEKKPTACCSACMTTACVCMTKVPCYYPQTYCQPYPCTVVYDPCPPYNCSSWFPFF